ncbi:MAG: hypothetical protein ABW352_15125 [Polyangiales bacterium]
MQLDVTRFPLLLVHWNGPEADEVMERFISAYDTFAQRAVRERRHYVVVSVGDADWTPRQRKRMAAWMDAHLDGDGRWDLGSHIVLHGALARGTLTALKWLVPRFQKVFVHPDEPSALAAAQASLEAARKVGRATGNSKPKRAG